MNIRLYAPGDPRQRTGGYLYNARMVAAWKAQGIDAAIVPVDTDAGHLPVGEQRAVRVVDGLMWTKLGERRKELAGHGPVVVLCHSPLYREAATLSEAAKLRREEEEALCEADGVVVTGKPTRQSLHISVPCALVTPGVDPTVVLSRQPSPMPVALTTATLTKRKGHDVLARALARMPHVHWWCAGTMDREPAWRDHLLSLVDQLQMTSRVTFLGELDQTQLAETMSKATFLLQGAHFEAYGMAIAEGLQAGLPVVSPDAGALVDLTGSAAWFPFAAGDVNDCERALYRVLAGLPAGMDAVGQLSFATWEEQSERFSRFVDSL